MHRIILSDTFQPISHRYDSRSHQIHSQGTRDHTAHWIRFKRYFCERCHLQSGRFVCIQFIWWGNDDAKQTSQTIDSYCWLISDCRLISMNGLASNWSTKSVWREKISELFAVVSFGSLANGPVWNSIAICDRRSTKYVYNSCSQTKICVFDWPLASEYPLQCTYSTCR